jgi:hypothetical protein
MITTAQDDLFPPLPAVPYQRWQQAREYLVPRVGDLRCVRERRDFW